MKHGANGASSLLSEDAAQSIRCDLEESVAQCASPGCNVQVPLTATAFANAADAPSSAARNCSGRQARRSPAAQPSRVRLADLKRRRDETRNSRPSRAVRAPPVDRAVLGVRLKVMGTFQDDSAVVGWHSTMTAVLEFQRDMFIRAHAGRAGHERSASEPQGRRRDSGRTRMMPRAAQKLGAAWSATVRDRAESMRLSHRDLDADTEPPTAAVKFEARLTLSGFAAFTYGGSRRASWTLTVRGRHANAHC